MPRAPEGQTAPCRRAPPAVAIQGEDRRDNLLAPRASARPGSTKIPSCASRSVSLRLRLSVVTRSRLPDRGPRSRMWRAAPPLQARNATPPFARAPHTHSPPLSPRLVYCRQYSTSSRRGRARMMRTSCQGERRNGEHANAEAAQCSSRRGTVLTDLDRVTPHPGVATCAPCSRSRGRRDLDFHLSRMNLRQEGSRACIAQPPRSGPLLRPPPAEERADEYHGDEAQHLDR